MSVQAQIKSHICQFKSHKSQFKSYISHFKSHIRHFKSNIIQFKSLLNHFQLHINQCKSHISQLVPKQVTLISILEGFQTESFSVVLKNKIAYIFRLICNSFWFLLLMGQECNVMKIQRSEIETFDLGHPVSTKNVTPLYVR